MGGGGPPALLNTNPVETADITPVAGKEPQSVLSPTTATSEASEPPETTPNPAPAPRIPRPRRRTRQVFFRPPRWAPR
jgi:hypothetical protein